MLHTGVVRMMWESWISKRSSISVSPVSSLQLSPRGPNFLFQLSKHWLQSALIGATGKNTRQLYLNNNCKFVNKIKTLQKWHTNQAKHVQYMLNEYVVSVEDCMSFTSQHHTPHIIIWKSKLLDSIQSISLHSDYGFNGSRNIKYYAHYRQLWRLSKALRSPLTVEL